MLSQEEQYRYSRQLILPEIGVEGQLKLKAAKVLVIGAGGLGCPVLQYLAAAGVGTIGIVDGDAVEESNLQRQVLYTTADIGTNKSLAAKTKIQALNPFIAVAEYPFHVGKENILSLVEAYDIVVDGTDNFATRYLVNDACVICNKPLVFGSIFKFEGQVAVFNYLDGPTYRCVFPEPPLEGNMPNCATIGVVASLPGIVGTLQANEVIKIITGIGEVLSGRLLLVDVMTMQMQTFTFHAVAKNRSIQQLGNYEYDCAAPDTTISYEALLQMMHETEVQLIDVREPEEHARFHIGGVNIPLAQLDAQYGQLNPSTPIVLYCALGIRSQKAVSILVNRGFANVVSLQGGINRLIPVV